MNFCSEIKFKSVLYVDKKDASEDFFRFSSQDSQKHSGRWDFGSIWFKNTNRQKYLIYHVMQLNISISKTYLLKYTLNNNDVKQTSK